MQPRRARCAACARTQVLLPAALSLRRADTVEVIGTALAAKAAGFGYRTIAAHMGRPVSTVRRWLRRVPETHVQWLCEQAVQHVFRLDPDILVRPRQWPSLLGWSLNVLAGAALAYRKRVEAHTPPWTLIGLFTRGHLLSRPQRI
ncbi:helix-turn-helix domain-containing protein [Arthrobacter sp. SDTb3-6]|uniref:helix-turn-helix domain-containing protein n=1 Tax=Arthrobacter sp. SDTb3-6 TaxID=2713571 RepID=UPI001C3FFF9F